MNAQHIEAGPRASEGLLRLIALTGMIMLFGASALALNATPGCSGVAAAWGEPDALRAVAVQAEAAPRVLRIVDPPARPFVAHGCVPVPAGAPTDLRVTGSLGSQSRVVCSSARWSIVEVAALVKAGTSSVAFSAAAGVAPTTSLVRADVLAFARAPVVSLRIEGQGGISETVSLRVAGKPWTLGPVRAGFAGTVHSRAFGVFRWWTTANAGDERVHLTLRWSNSLDAAGAARPEFLFRSVSIAGLPAGVAWSNALGDPSVAPPYLVKPLDHSFPQRALRDFRLVFHRVGHAAPRAPDGWGVGDWTAGGWLPAGLAIPAVSGAAAETSRRAAAEVERFAAVRGTGGTSDAPRLSALWPYAGVPYGGMTGEVDIWPYDGCLTAASGLRAGLDMHRILAARYGLRQRLIFEADGQPLVPEAHLIGGAAEWSTYDFDFQRQFGAPGGTNDAPFEFDRLAVPVGPRAYSWSGVAPIDCQHLIRAVKDARALVWLDGDPAAAEYLVAVAEMGRATFWTGAGRARRLVPPARPGIGVEVGRAEAWQGATAAAAAMLGRAGMREWLGTLASICSSGTTPSGLFAASRNGKAATSPPMSGRFLAHRGNELSYFAGLWRECEALGMDVRGLLESGARGTRDMAWAPGFGGCWDRHVVGLADASAMYRTRAEVPAGVYDPTSLERWSYYAGNLVGSFGLDDLDAEWRRVVALRAGAVVSRDGAPIEVWLPSVSRWGWR